MQNFILEDGFVQVPKIVFHDKKVSSGELRTYIALRSHRNNNDFLGCFPGLETIGREAGFAKETVSKHLKALKVLGHISIKHRYNNSNIYWFPSETVKCKCTDLCKKSAKKKDIYWDYCIENLDMLRMNEGELRESFINIYEKEPSVDNLLKFLKEIEIAKEIKDENR